MISPGHSHERQARDRNDDRRNFLPRVDGDFQWRYSFALALAVGITLVVFMGPFLYFLNQNFEIFRSLAVQYQPNLLEHLEREVEWLTFIGFAGLVVAVGFSLVFGYKLTGTIMGPLFSIERHMKKVAQGDWTREDFRVRATDEFKRLASAYAHFYRHVRTELSEDLEQLKNLKSLALSQRNNEEIRQLLSAMIEAKERKLGIQKETPENTASDASNPKKVRSTFSASEGSDESREKRRAS